MAEGDVIAAFTFSTTRIVLPASGGSRQPRAEAMSDPTDTTGDADPTDTTGAADLPDGSGSAQPPDAEGEVTC